MKILITDYDFPNLELERGIFAAANIEVATAQCRSEEAVIEAARGCSALLVQYAPVTERVLAALPQIGLISRFGAGNIVVEYLDDNGAVVGSPGANFMQIGYVRVRIANYQHRLLIPLFDLTFNVPAYPSTLPRESLGVPRVGTGPLPCGVIAGAMGASASVRVVNLLG